MDDLPDCPFCGLHGLRVTGLRSSSTVQCLNEDCGIYQVRIPLKKWKQRPIEDRLQSRIRELKSREMIIVVPDAIVEM